MVEEKIQWVEREIKKLEGIPEDDKHYNIVAHVKDKVLTIDLYNTYRYRLSYEYDGKMLSEVRKSSIYPHDGHHKVSITPVEGIVKDLEWKLTLYSPDDAYEGFQYVNGSEKVIEAFTGITTRYGFCEFMKLLSAKVKNKSLYERTRREYEAKEDLFKQLPEEPANLIEYASKHPLKTSCYFFTRPHETSKSKRDFYCSTCGKTTIEKAQKDTTKFHCKHCGTYGTVKYAKNHNFCDESRFVVFQLSNDGKGFFVRYYLCHRDYRKSYYNVKTEICEIGRYYLAPGEVRLWTTQKHSQSTQNQYFTSEVKKERVNWYPRGMFYFYGVTDFYPGYQDIIRQIFPYSALDIFLKKHSQSTNKLVPVLAYLHKYAKANQLEYFAKAGLDEFIMEHLQVNLGRYGRTVASKINWQGKTFEKMFKLPKAQIKRYIFSHKLDDSVKLYIAQELHKSNMLTDENLDLMLDIAKKLSNPTTMDFIKEFGPELVKTAKYLLYQNTKQTRYSDQIPSLNYMITEYKDYLAMSRQIGRDLNSEYFKYPKYLKKAHDDVQRLIKTIEDEKKNKKLAERLKGLKRYYFEHENLLIRPAQSIKEISEEGKKQKICIASGHYIDSYISGSCILLFIRDKSRPTVPFYALEVRGANVIQCRGAHNCNPTPEVKAAVDAFVQAKLEKKKREKKPVENRIQVAV